MNQKFARAAGYICLGLAILTAIGMAFFFLWIREHEDERIRKQALPWPDRAAVIRVLNSEGTEVIREITDTRQLSEWSTRMRRAPRTHFEEPGPGGPFYRLELRRADEQLLAIFIVSDYRQYGASLGGLIYPPKPKKNEVWTLSENMVSELVDTAAPA
ncbi:hypothetical protein [Cohnella sp. AR92]|uniref:hypothetical protein n=1 Tax=Cohnella sp. AR92 TaxID=648716 RepID=UPI000F8D6251|nr:hypothetical protein [Cohnella sp. AR92]RUS48839.1 hypothetical protein ELR57_00365 [Cohnella sp. AR92]